MINPKVLLWDYYLTESNQHEKTPHNDHELECLGDGLEYIPSSLPTASGPRSASRTDVMVAGDFQCNQAWASQVSISNLKSTVLF